MKNEKLIISSTSYSRTDSIEFIIRKKLFIVIYSLLIIKGRN